MSYTKQAVILGLWLNVCTYGTRMIFWHESPGLGPFVITWIICLLYLVIGRHLDHRRRKS